MPNASFGFTGTEIVALVKNYIGNQSSDFQTFVEQTLPLAEFRFCKAHDWSFLNKANLPLTVSSGTNVYTLGTGNIGYNMVANDVRNIFSVTNNVYLKKITLDEIRRMDPNNDDGNSGMRLSHWAPINENDIQVYPGNAFVDTALKIDGKITPGALLTLSNYPTIPYRFQESFIEYVKALALDRENDDRAPNAKQEANAKIMQDIRSDVESLGGVGDRMKHQNEARYDGVSGNLEALYNQWVWNQE